MVNKKMTVVYGKRISRSSTSVKRGRGLLNKVIDLLPVELHIPGGYRYCGPGTRLTTRLSRGDPGINQLDEACKQHDIAYAKYSDDKNRNIADRILANKAWERVTSTDASLAERAAAWAVTTAMKTKSKLGMGHTRRRRACRKRRCRTNNIRKKKITNKSGGGTRRRVNHQRRRKTAKGLYLRPYPYAQYD